MKRLTLLLLLATTATCRGQSSEQILHSIGSSDMSAGRVVTEPIYMDVPFTHLVKLTQECLFLFMRPTGKFPYCRYLADRRRISRENHFPVNRGDNREASAAERWLRRILTARYPYEWFSARTRTSPKQAWEQRRSVLVLDTSLTSRPEAEANDEGIARTNVYSRAV